MSQRHFHPRGAHARRMLHTAAIFTTAGAAWLQAGLPPTGGGGATASGNGPASPASSGKGDLMDDFKKSGQWMDEAKSLQGKGDFEAALKKAQEAVDQMPVLPGPLSLRAGILMDLNRYKEALDDWQTVNMLSGDDPTDGWYIHLQLSLCHLKLGDKPAALADAQKADRLAPKTLDADQRKELDTLLGQAAPDAVPPLGATWSRLMKNGGREIASIWELHADGVCLVHSQPIQADGSYTIAGPFKEAWPGDLETHVGTATFQLGRWQMAFTQPKAETVAGTYALSADGEELVVTQDGFDGKFTRKRVATLVEGPLPDFFSDSGPAPTASPSATPAATPSVAAIDYFDWGTAVSALSDYAYHQRIANQLEAQLTQKRALIERLNLGDEVLGDFDALARLMRANGIPSGSYNDWSRRQQRRWDNEFVPAANALGKASITVTGKTTEADFFYTLGYNTYMLAVALPEDVHDYGIGNENTRNDLKNGLDEFVWLQKNLPQDRLTPEVADAVSNLADYKARLDDLGGEPMPQSYVEKIIALAAAIFTAEDAGKFLK